MKNSILAYALGVVTGVGFTVLYFKLAEKEKEEVVSEVVYVKSSPEEKGPESEKQHVDANKKPDIMEYAREIQKNRYNTKYSNAEEANPVKGDELPQISSIPPEVFGDIEEYPQYQYTYYQGDGVLANELDQEIVDVEDTVGLDIVDHIGEFDSDVAYIQNDIRGCYYEVSLDLRSFKEVTGTDPQQEE